MSTELTVRPTAKILPFPQALVWHEMAQQILAIACEKAIARGVLSAETCFHLRTAARKLDTFHIRAIVTLVLDRMEEHHAST